MITLGSWLLDSQAMQACTRGRAVLRDRTVAFLGRVADGLMDGRGSVGAADPDYLFALLAAAHDVAIEDDDATNLGGVIDLAKRIINDDALGMGTTPPKDAKPDSRAAVAYVRTCQIAAAWRRLKRSVRDRAGDRRRDSLRKQLDEALALLLTLKTGANTRGAPDAYRSAAWIRKATEQGLYSDLLGKMRERRTLVRVKLVDGRWLYDVNEVAEKRSQYMGVLLDALAERADFRKPRKTERRAAQAKHDEARRAATKPDKSH